MSNSINKNATLASIIPQVGWHGGKAIPGLIVGVPGVAKTRFMEGLAAALDEALHKAGLNETPDLQPHEHLELATYVLPQTSPDALEGIAVPSEDRTTLKRLPLADLKRLNEAKYGILFGDELSSANPETGAAFMTFASDGRAGDLKLHDRVARMFAMNPASCAAAGRELSPPEANRFCWIKWDLPLADFQDYLRGGPGLLSHVVIIPKDWEQSYGARTKTLLASFLDSKRELVNELDRDISQDMQTSATNKVDPTKAWASQRSWENAMRLAAACMSTGATLRSELVKLAIEGCVGETAATAFFKWIADASIPDPEEMLADPKTAISKLPKRPDYAKACLEQLALCGCDAASAERKKIDPMVRWKTAYKIIAEVFAKNKDAAYSSLQILFRKPPRPLNNEEMKDGLFKDMVNFRKEVGLGG